MIDTDYYQLIWRPVHAAPKSGKEINLAFQYVTIHFQDPARRGVVCYTAVFSVVTQLSSPLM